MVILLITIEVVLNPLGRRMRVRIPGIGVGLGRDRKAEFGFICSKSIQSANYQHTHVLCQDQERFFENMYN